MCGCCRKPLAVCISDYVDDPNLKKAAERATWLGSMTQKCPRARSSKSASTRPGALAPGLLVCKSTGRFSRSSVTEPGGAPPWRGRRPWSTTPHTARFPRPQGWDARPPEAEAHTRLPFHGNPRRRTRGRSGPASAGARTPSRWRGRCRAGLGARRGPGMTTPAGASPAPGPCIPLRARRWHTKRRPGASPRLGPIGRLETAHRALIIPVDEDERTPVLHDSDERVVGLRRDRTAA
jgi:hypothetical protein